MDLVDLIGKIWPKLTNQSIKNRLTRLSNSLLDNVLWGNQHSLQHKINIMFCIKNILQWNLNRFYKNLDEIKILINLHQSITLYLQETNFKYNDSPLIINNFHSAIKNHSDCARASRGVCILVINTYRYVEIPTDSTLEVIAVSVLLESKKTLCNSLSLNRIQN